MSKKDEALKLARHVMHNQGDIGVDEWIATEKAIDEALAEQHEMTNIERHERNVQKFLAEQPAQPLQEEGSAEYWASKYPVPLGYELVKKNPAQPAPMIRGDIRDGLVDDEPAQQEPVARQYQNRDGVWKDFISEKHYKDTLEDGSWPIRNLYKSPPAQRDIRNATLDEIANKIAAMPFGDTAASFAVWIREQKT